MDYFKAARFFLYLIPLAVVIVTPSTLFPFIVGKYVWFRAFSALAIISFLIGLLFDKRAAEYKERLKKVFASPLTLAVSAFALIYLIACFFGIDPGFSFWSNFERGEGGLQILHLWAFFVLLLALFRNEKEWHSLLKVALVGATLMILYGVGVWLKYAGVGVFGDFFIGSPFGNRFDGSIGNSSYVAAHLIFAAYFAAILALTAKKGERLRFVLAICFFGIFIVFAATRGAFIGLILGTAAALVFLMVRMRRWRKPILGGLVILAILFGTLFMFRNAPVVQKLPFARLLDISFSTGTFKHRLAAWDIAWKGFLERPLLGWGPGNYLHLYERIYHPDFYDVENSNYGAWFDRAHSIFFDYLAESGAAGVVGFLSIFGVLGWRIARRYKEAGEDAAQTKMQALALGAAVAYLVQGLVLFNVLVIYLPLMTFLAWSEFRFNEKLQAGKT